MPQEITLKVNGRIHHLSVEPDTPLIYILRNDLGLKGIKIACGLEQCGACKVIVDGSAVPSCRLPVKNVQGLAITTIEGLGSAGDLHPLQEAFVEEQAIQCGYCTPGMIIAAQGLLNRQRYPTDNEIREALVEDLCRCGVYDRVRRAIKLRIGQSTLTPIHEVTGEELQPGSAPYDLTGALPHSLQQTPELDAWIRINTDGTISIFTGKVELGQGLKTALAQIAAEELDVSIERIQVRTADTARTPDEGPTVSSMSLETSGNALRFAAAEARHRLLLIAFEELEAPINRLTVTDGTIADPATGRSITYWDLFGGLRFGGQVTGLAQPKQPADYRLVGQPAKRLDLLAKVTGKACFVHDLELPGMVHGRIVRPPGYRATLIAVDEEKVGRMPGVLKVVRDGSFLAVIAEREEQAVRAIEALREAATWDDKTHLPTQTDLFDHLASQPVESYLIVDGEAVDDPIPPLEAPAEASHTLTAKYHRPYQMHASLGPSAAVAQMVDGQLTVWTHSQGVFLLRASIAHVLGLPESAIRLIHMEGPGCYGHNGADDAALDAALLARALPGLPISLKWLRQEEHAWEPYGPAMVVEMQASLNADGQVIDWNHEVWSPAHLGRARSGPGLSGLLAAWHLAQPFSPPPSWPARFRHGGSHRNADPLYDFPRRRIVKHYVPHSPLRVSSLRSLGAYANIFALESFMDELAKAAGADPVEFRLRHLSEQRARAVVEAAAGKTGWGSPDQLPGRDGGRGFAFAQYKNQQAYAAVVVDLQVDPVSGQIRLLQAVIAADAGQIINPDGLSNQLEGGFVQAASLTLKEQVNFDQHGLTSLDWDSYPILRFPDAPQIETILLDHPDQPLVGSGEATMGPTPAAIANAIYDAVGIRLREIPFTPERVKSALARKTS